MNRLDHVVVFRSLGAVELRKSVDIELDIVQQRIRAVASENRFSITVTESAKKFLLSEGTDVRYGARPLKRAIEGLLVRPLSNLVASRQIQRGASIRVSHPPDAPCLTFSCNTESVRASRAGCEAA